MNEHRIWKSHDLNEIVTLVSLSFEWREKLSFWRLTGSAAPPMTYVAPPTTSSGRRNESIMIGRRSSFFIKMLLFARDRGPRQKEITTWLAGKEKRQAQQKENKYSSDHLAFCPGGRAVQDKNHTKIPEAIFWHLSGWMISYCQGLCERNLKSFSRYFNCKVGGIFCTQRDLNFKYVPLCY